MRLNLAISLVLFTLLTQICTVSVFSSLSKSKLKDHPNFAKSSKNELKIFMAKKAASVDRSFSIEGSLAEEEQNIDELVSNGMDMEAYHQLLDYILDGYVKAIETSSVSTIEAMMKKDLPSLDDSDLDSEDNWISELFEKKTMEFKKRLYLLSQKDLSLMLNTCDVLVKEGDQIAQHELKEQEEFEKEQALEGEEDEQQDSEEDLEHESEEDLEQDSEEDLDQDSEEDLEQDSEESAEEQPKNKPKKKEKKSKLFAKKMVNMTKETKPTKAIKLFSKVKKMANNAKSYFAKVKIFFY